MKWIGFVQGKEAGRWGTPLWIPSSILIFFLILKLQCHTRCTYRSDLVGAILNMIFIMGKWIFNSVTSTGVISKNKNDSSMPSLTSVFKNVYGTHLRSIWAVIRVRICDAHPPVNDVWQICNMLEQWSKPSSLYCPASGSSSHHLFIGLYLLLFCLRLAH